MEALSPSCRSSPRKDTPRRRRRRFLEDCLGKLGFDPESFLRMDPKKQAEVLRELVGLDFSALDAERAKIYENRTLLAREGKSLRGQLDGCKKHDDAPAEEVSITELAGVS